MSLRSVASPSNVGLLVIVVVLLILPGNVSDFFITNTLTETLILGLIAASIVFLTAQGGMISLAQLLLAGVAGFMFGNAASDSAARGLNLGWNPWMAVLFALAVATLVALVLGAVASRTTGIYFLMLTLVYGVIGVSVFAQVVDISGPSGLSSIVAPDPFDDPFRRYHAAVILSALTYLALRGIGRTNFGLSLQGVRDDPVRMGSLGFNVALHRTLAFAIGGFFAGIGGVLNVWWRGQIDPTTISIGPTLILLIIAVIGGISHLEGAWLGAFVYVLLETYTTDIPLIDRIGLTPDRFNTIIGLVVLLIMVLSPEGLMGILERLRRGRGLPKPTEPSIEPPTTTHVSTESSPAQEP